MTPHPEGQWNEFARRWALHGPPLRPSPLDVEHYQAAVDALAARRPIRSAVILGVTPELHGLRWPSGTALCAVDRSAEMIAAVWPGPADAARLGDWTAPLLPAASVDLVLCDGGLHLLDADHGQPALVAELARSVAPGGRVVFRLFARPAPTDVPETTGAVLAALAAGAIADMNELKIRLGHALTPDAATGVALATVWQALHAAIGDRDAFFARLGWSPAAVAVIDLYRDSPVRYHFTTVDEAIDRFCGGPAPAFRLVEASPPAQRLGERCVHLCLERCP